MKTRTTLSKARALSLRRQAGATLIEVLVSLLILLVGMLGLVGLMIEGQRAHLESYQRMQALLLVQDMANRISANRNAAECYLLADYLGVDKTVVPSAGACATGTAAEKDIVEDDLTDWLALLTGSAELSSGGDAVGAVLGARGCITMDPATGVLQVSVAWQGMGVGYAPPAGIACAKDLYGDDSQRRAVSVTL